MAPAKLERDALGEFANVHVSENAVVKWGPSGDVKAADVERLTSALEHIWSSVVVDMGHPAPAGCEAYLLNIYLANTGGPSPSMQVEGAYTMTDADGYPALVLHHNLLNYYATHAEAIDSIATHAFYRSIQLGTGAFQTQNAQWYWWATGEWVVRYVYPEYVWTQQAVGAYALLPHVSTTHVGMPDNDQSVIDAHHFGAQILPLFISDEIADPSVIRDSWLRAGSFDDPLHVLAGLLAEKESSMAELFADFAAHNATWDYRERGDVFAQAAQMYAQSFPEQDHRLAAVVRAGGTRGFVPAPEPTLPWAWGYNVIEFDHPVSGNLRVRFRGAPRGSTGSASRFAARIVRKFPNGITLYQDVPIDRDGVADTLIEGIAHETELYFVVASVPSTTTPAETFAYEYALEIVSREDARTGCARAVRPAPRAPAGVLLIAPLALLFVIQRRRRRDNSFAS